MEHTERKKSSYRRQRTCSFEVDEQKDFQQSWEREECGEQYPQAGTSLPLPHPVKEGGTHKMGTGTTPGWGRKLYFLLILVHFGGFFLYFDYKNAF